MRASVLTPALELVIEQRPVPPVATNDVLVQVSSVGVCGSDVHYYRHGRIADFVVEQPMVLGHEAAGRIVAAGEAVDPRRIGERVSIEPQRPRLDSAQSLSGHYNLDPDIEFYATPPIDGAFAEYVSIPSVFAHRIPESMSDDAAALLEPLSVGIAAAQKAQLTVGDKVLIAGAGPIGLVLVQVAAAYGATEIVVSDLDAARLALAEQLGATASYDPRRGEQPEEPRFDVFFDASGAAPAVVAGIRALAPLGRAVLVGMGADDYALPISTIQNRELLVTGVFRYANTWPTAIGLVQSGAVNLDVLVSGRFGLDQVKEALDTAGSAEVLKNMVLPGLA
ncbi:NAD(P)-dependent alcohol dehydrogenase [Psychromicrobium lacuslunae]|uniref:Sorbitol dehydrogenase n=1 Tax=Psychromicrobium lacuslunae TaxID=1618207 RepID=A0A0D4C4B3_9MICC|nr:NAD(P)-dependent alcohol dehydrogenase [Psychromicrobium lacuslunae]AJT43221.1 sorbitol dehydrogenase [Psychromicrobium lacuslunae]